MCKRSSRPQNRRWWAAAIVLVLIAVVAGWHWWRGRAFHYIGSHSEAAFLLVRSDGIVTLEGRGNHWDARTPITLALRDWKWRRRWQLAVPSVKQVDPRDPEGRYSRIFGVSPNGHLIAVAVDDVAQKRLSVLLLRDNHEVTRMQLPRKGPLSSEVTVLDDGRIFLTQSEGRELHLYLVRDGQLQAEGHLTASRTLAGNAVSSVTAAVAPDLSCLGLVSRTSSTNEGRPECRYATLTVIGSRLVVTPEFVMKNSSYPICLTDGIVIDGLDPGSTLYRKSGKMPNPRGWQLYPFYPPKAWIMQTDGNRARVYSPATGQSWPLPQLVPASRWYYSQFCYITPNGRFAIIPYSGPRRLGSAAPLFGLLARIPPLRRPVERWRGHETFSYELYARPGRLLARLNGIEEKEGGETPYSYTLKGEHFNFSHPILSPDGRHLVLITTAVEPRIHSQMLLFSR